MLGRGCESESVVLREAISRRDLDDAKLPLVAVQVGHDFKFRPFYPLLADGDDRQAKVSAGVSPARERMNQAGGRIGMWRRLMQARFSR